MEIELSQFTSFGTYAKYHEDNKKGAGQDYWTDIVLGLFIESC